ncbi:hypothetical protein PYDG_00024 [Pseudoalteromonas phage pYD6-A]|uniref:Uncharacterized protein n=1 Tax=Pseudoalteromonas phage pYD6-A TaxID=754052 RepID=M4SRX4_9CAUD|nr:hypothetical protein PYDG_00024 [Pseudoalteromonas phage pYD6-A]AGH57556.1 hypothetical protein PYDG_00024 [Pseudoalteromonas phage pYD6-A]
MQAKANQKKYICPYCESQMKHEVNDGYSQEVHLIYCTNEDCDVEGINWDVAKLESYEINKIQRVEELLDGK